MSVAAKKWVRRHSSAKGNCKTVLAELAWAGDDEGRGAFLSGHQLAKATGLHRNTVDRALSRLEEAGYIVRHHGDRSHCAACARAQRRVRVFDVVMPAVETVDPDQTSLFDLHQNEPAAVQVTEVVMHQPGASTCTAVVQLEEKRTEEQQQQERGREDSNELRETVERVVSALSPTRLFVDRYSIEGVVMRNAGRDIDGAVAAIVALAADPAYRLPKGGAAMMLLIELRRQAPAAASRFPRPVAPLEPADLPDRFAKYDEAMGMTG